METTKEFLQKISEVILNEISEQEDIKTSKEIGLYLKSLQSYVKKLRTSYRDRNVLVDYKLKQIQFAYLLVYYPGYAYMTYSVLKDFLVKNKSKNLEINKQVMYINSNNYENYLNLNLEDIELPDSFMDYINNIFQKTNSIKVAFFAGGPCPELVGLLFFISKYFPKITTINCHFFDINAVSWQLSNNITKKIANSISSQINLNFNYHDIDFNKETFFYQINSILPYCNICFIQNCLNEIGNIKKFSDNLILILRELPINKSLFFMIDLYKHNKNQQFLSVIETKLKTTSLVQVIRDCQNPLEEKLGYTHPFVTKHLLDSSDQLIPRKNLYFNYLTFINHPYLESVDDLKLIQEEKRKDILKRIHLGQLNTHINCSLNDKDVYIKNEIYKLNFNKKAIYIDLDFLLKAIDLTIKILYKVEPDRVENILNNKLILKDIDNNILQFLCILFNKFSPLQNQEIIEIYIYNNNLDINLNLKNGEVLKCQNINNEEIGLKFNIIDKSLGKNKNLKEEFCNLARFTIYKTCILVCDEAETYDELLTLLLLQNKKVLNLRLDNLNTKIKAESIWDDIVYSVSELMGFNREETRYAIVKNRFASSDGKIIEELIEEMVIEKIKYIEEVKQNVQKEKNCTHFLKSSNIESSVSCDICNSKIFYNQGYYVYCALENIGEINLKNNQKRFMFMPMNDMLICEQCGPEVFNKWNEVTLSLFLIYLAQNNSDFHKNIEAAIILGCKNRGLAQQEAQQEAKEMSLLWWQDKDKALKKIKEINNM